MAFSLEVMDEKEIRKAAERDLALPEKKELIISDTAKKKADEILNVDLDSFKDKKEILDVIQSLGAEEVRQSGKKCALLKTRIGDLSKAGGESGAVSRNYTDLVVIMKDLDPSIVDFGFDESGFFKKFISPVRKYFAKYEKADAALDKIVRSMNNGITGLKNDNVTLGLHQQDLRELTKRLMEKDKLAEELDRYLSAKLDELRLEPEKDEVVKFVENEILYHLRQSRLTYAQIITVNEQSYITDETIRRGNTELIRAAERGRDVSVAALQTGAIAAAALYNQKIMLSRISALNEATNQTIASVAAMLKTQGRDITQKAMESNIDIEAMKKAFADTYATFDEIEQSRREALPVLAKTIAEFKEMAAQSEQVIARIEAGSHV